MNEYQLLTYILELCEEHGGKYEHIYFDVNPELIEKIYDRYGLKLSVEELNVIVDLCYENAWLVSSDQGGDQSRCFTLTSKGMEDAISKRKSDELRKNRSFWEVASDYINDHKALFILLGVGIALSGFIL